MARSVIAGERSCSRTRAPSRAARSRATGSLSRAPAPASSLGFAARAVSQRSSVRAPRSRSITGLSEVPQMGPLTGQVAIVTGAATGIGKAIAGRLAADGADVVVNHLDTPAEADALVTSISEAGGSAVAIQADISRREEFARLFAGAADRFGHVDILVNNAAVAIL